jgi:hypothetical protein
MADSKLKNSYAAYQTKDDPGCAGLRGHKLTYKAVASRDTYQNIETNTTVKDYFDIQDYYSFRPNEAVAKKPKAIIKQCMDAYRQVGLLRNVIDLMSDFGSQGIKLIHPNPKIQKFYRDWFEQVVGPDRSERFLNLLYRSGNVIIRRTNAKVTKKIASNMRAYAGADKPIKKEKIDKNTIPWKYTFLSPLCIEAVGDELTQFVGQNKYALKIPRNLYNIIKHPSTDLERQLIQKIPKDIKAAILKGEGLLLLDDNDIVVKFYKKDDWQAWADPMLYCIMDDVIMLDKLKLADRAALDGIISQVRLWKLGDLEKELFPNETAINKLVNVLSSNPGGGPFDIIWGPDLTFDETSTEAYKFLGSSKYEPTLNDIHAGLGVPSTLTGAGSDSGFTNNFISLKTLVKRLEYGRSLLTSWWDEEIYRVQQSMGFRLPAKVRYDRMILTDEAAEKALLKDLWDRNLITDATITERFGEDPELESLVNMKEEKERSKNKRLPKAGPHHTAEKEHELAKLAVGRGYVKPSDVGVDVEESYDREPLMEQIEAMAKKTGNEPDPKSTKDSPGRPFNSKDSKQRQRTVKPRTSAEKVIWAKDAQNEISRILNPHILSFFNKSDMRTLTNEEFQRCENVKFAALSQLEAGEDISEDRLMEICGNNSVVSEEFQGLYDNYVSDKRVNLADRKLYQALVYAELK